jgi:16S rRNA (cytidine1402-2'-O)-methyltransferase
MSKLYVIGTPIGNLEDISLRALRILKEVDLILCEDTRVTKKLLSHYEIKNDTMSYHAQSKLTKVEKILDLLREDKNLALVSDAGTPTISDPGIQLISKIKEELREVEIIAIPGPSALTSAKRTVVFYESPHRILKTLESLKQFCPDKKVSIARELTKIHEEVLSGTAEELLALFEENSEKVRGEFVVIVSK